MNRLHITLACLILSIFQVFLSPVALANTTKAVGTLPGAFSVGTDGAANYHIPVALPPGINGLTPNLALEYDSQKNNGLVGVGWRLAGFPVISRCPTTLEKDGFIDGVDFDDNDKFCLNGQRLVAIKGTYGANGTEYRTEYDNYKKIISYGAVGNGPAYFKVIHKNGEIATFASNHDARLILKDHSDVLRWSLTAIEDRFRSMINYRYTTHADTGEQVPAQINYANTTIKFHYEAREDQQQTYLDGAPLSVTQRLNTIEIIHGEKSQRYILNYETTPVTHKSLLSSLQLCSTQCQPVTQLRWQFNETALNDKTTKRLNDLGTNHGWHVGQHPRYLRDVNGDGLTDIVAFGSGGAFTFLSSGTGFDTEPSTVSEFGTRQGWSTAKHPRHLADVNGDGKADIVGFADAGVYVSLSTGSGMAPATRWLADLGYGSGWHTDLHPRIVQDINGDGRADILAFGSGGAFVSYSTGTGFTPVTTAVAAFGTRQGWSTAKHLRELADVNGDGLADIVGFAGDGVYVAFNSHEGFLPAQRLLADLGYSSGWHTDLHPRFMRDVNGDGRADIVAFGSGGVFVSYSTGTGFTPITAVLDEFGTRQGWQVHKNPRFLGDVNNDGLDDIIGLANNGVYVSFNTGSGFSPARKILDNFAYSQGWTADKNPRAVYDFDGNGTTDFFGFAGDGLYTSLSPFTPPRLVGISNGFDHEVKLSYAPLTDKSIFTKSEGSQYPIKDIQPSTFVVSTVQTSNGIGGFSTTRYKYGELKYHQQGLGFLGFRTVTSTQEDTGIRTHSVYAQHVDTHVIGALKNQKTYAKDGVVLKDLQQSWLTHTLNDGDIPRYQTIMTRAFTEQRSLQDVQLSQTTQHLAYDAYGNVTESKTVTTDTYGQQQSTTVNTYLNDEDHWLIGLPTQTQTTNVGVAGDSQTRTTQFSYDATTGALTQRIQEPSQGDYVLTTEFKYDSFGNLIEEQTQGAKVTARKQTYTYDADGRFLISTTNALGHTSAQTLHPYWGSPVISMDANGLVTTYEYDDFGRLISQKAPDNTQTTLTRGWCNAETECPAGAVYWVKTQA
ncbi:FG-GAP-like repeat-containing protein, partial [Zooshikella ganghwensis]|uniref:FG-GAP-like repeat-containing protein n=1 Tax=Zooshikella ganghwensis TaxID=202772 RepID=UPI000687D6FB